ncbi:MAG: cyclase family protein [Nitrososphaerales archaeon]
MKRLRVDFSRVIDLSQTISNASPTYPGDTKPSIDRIRRIGINGSAYNLSRLTISPHVATHVDAPLHFLSEGRCVGDLDPFAYSGEAVVVDFSSKNSLEINAEDLEAKAVEVRSGFVVLLYTGFSKIVGKVDWLRNYTALTEDGAKWLIDKGVKAVGTDALSIERYDSKDYRVHKLLLQNSIGIIEGLSDELKRLIGVKILFICLPLKIECCEGAPARAIAVKLS